MLTAQAKEDFKQFIERIISYAVVTVNGKEEKKSHSPQGKTF